jgi:hypothetical protein
MGRYCFQWIEGCIPHTDIIVAHDMCDAMRQFANNYGAHWTTQVTVTKLGY